MPFCTQCGVELSSSANFCRRCGSRVRKSKPAFVNSITTTQMLQKAREKVKNFSQPKIEQSQDFVVSKIDSVTETLKDPEKLTSLSTNQKDYLAQRLASLRAKISKEQANNGSKEFELSLEEADEIIELNDELLNQLESEKCLICYKDLKNNENRDDLVVCPQCGHGGHRSHIYEWFQSNKTCPYCKAQITVDQVLILHY